MDPRITTNDPPTPYGNGLTPRTEEDTTADVQIAREAEYINASK